MQAEIKFVLSDFDENFPKVGEILLMKQIYNYKYLVQKRSKVYTWVKPGDTGRFQIDTCDR